MTTEAWTRLRRSFVESNMTLEEIASLSESIVGQHVSYEQVKDRSKRDPAGSWEILRAAYRSSNAKSDIAEEVDTIRQLVYRQIVHSSLSGVFVYGDVDLDDVRKAIKGVRGVEGCAQINPSLDASYVNSYMNLLAKSGKSGLPRPSAKSSRQQVIDLIKESSKKRE